MNRRLRFGVLLVALLAVLAGPGVAKADTIVGVLAFSNTIEPQVGPNGIEVAGENSLAAFNLTDVLDLTVAPITGWTAKLYGPGGVLVDPTPWGDDPGDEITVDLPWLWSFPTHVLAPSPTCQGDQCGEVFVPLVFTRVEFTGFYLGAPVYGTLLPYEGEVLDPFREDPDTGFVGESTPLHAEVPVPEPATLLLVGSGIAALVKLRRR